ncbi:MAG: hypothetical protein CVU11_10415 [Bacteroidetes bacterium HGW-Bacteroidetes-6]|nr:MAG: hypothetical protein CVU11_10415 [Bacteroidetes bacterium HGW-Bacteroidetes-6]
MVIEFVLAKIGVFWNDGVEEDFSGLRLLDGGEYEALNFLQALHLIWSITVQFTIESPLSLSQY